MLDIYPRVHSRFYFIIFTVECYVTAVAGEGYVDAADSGTLVWDPKVVENLTDEERKCTVFKYHCSHTVL